VIAPVRDPERDESWSEMTEIGPWMIAAHTKEQAEYVARSQAEQGWWLVGQGCSLECSLA